METSNLNSTFTLYLPMGLCTHFYLLLEGAHLMTTLKETTNLSLAEYS